MTMQDMRLLTGALPLPEHRFALGLNLKMSGELGRIFLAGQKMAPLNCFNLPPPERVEAMLRLPQIAV